MTDRLDDALSWMEAELAGHPGVRAFAEAVVRHLVGPPAERSPAEEVVETVTRTLLQILAQDGDAAMRTLLGDPQLLASFFQNADLLAPRGAESRAVTQTVMRAVGHGWERSA